MRQYNHIILGGTFDHFHAGHELFLKTALTIGKKVTIGITTELLYRHKTLASTIETYAVREKRIRAYISTIQKNSQEIKLISLTDVYGNSLKDMSVDAILVTPVTKNGALLINKKRKEAHMKPLCVIVVSLVRGEDGRVISSDRIRYGDIDRSGNNYYKWLIDKAPLLLPDGLRTLLRKPLGDLIRGTYHQRKEIVHKILRTIKKINPPMIYAIGDIIAGSLWREGFQPSVAVIDYKSRREPLSKVQNSKFKVQNVRQYRNTPGTISQSAIKQVRVLRNRWLRDRHAQQLVIQGEEDLIALPSILFAPLNSIVLYGQYDLGVVVVKVTEDKKREAMNLLNKFDSG